MADVAESAAFTDAATAISHGKRHLLVRDYTMAVTALAQACQLLAEKHGDTADELGEPYLLYGRALLGLAREEAGVLGGGVPGSEEAEEDDEEEEEEGEEKLSSVDEKEEEEEEERNAAGASGKKEESKTEEKREGAKIEGTREKSKNEKESSVEPEAEKKDKLETSSEKKEEKAEASSEKTEEKTEVKSEEKAKTSSSEKTEKTETKVEEKKEKGKVIAGSSKDASRSNGPSCSTEQNGVAEANDEDEGEDIGGKEDEEDEVNNLQVAWEVLELAKLVLQKRGEGGSRLLADAYRLLGEVAMEGGNFQGALNDLHKCLELLQQTEPREPRAIAEIHYQLALAHSLGNEFDASIEEFNKATELLQARIKELEEIKEPPKTDDTFYTVEGEIQELKELLPEIQEKISDMKDFKQEACRLVIEGIKSKVAGGCSNGAGPSGSSGESASKVQKPASDISHLVRKKRKAEEPETTEASSPCKKPTPEKAV